MVRHASSHGFSVLMCTIVASFLVEVLKPFIPGLLDRIRGVSNLLVELFGIPLSVDFFTIVLVASALALIWGIFFKLRYAGNYAAK